VKSFFLIPDCEHKWIRATFKSCEPQLTGLLVRG
jgi:hypothetical protein